MKTHCSIQRNHGLTLVELVVVIFGIAFLIALLLPVLAAEKKKQSRLSCVTNLKEIDLAYRIWEGDNRGLYPTDVSVTNGGAMESAATGDVAAVFQVMSNELGTPKILICSQDATHTLATNFAIGFSAKNTSYFVGVDAKEANPQMMLSGDDNFEIGGVPVESGLLQISTNTPIAWSAARHGHAGNVALTDGSVQQLTTSGLQQAFQNAGAATNRIAIP
jgi:prepilin-type processing-associated H-X9-DG protein